MSAGRDVQIDGKIDGPGVDTCGVVQNQFADRLRKLQGERSHDPSAERMSEQESTFDRQRPQKLFEHLYEPRDAVVDQRLVTPIISRRADKLYFALCI